MKITHLAAIVAAAAVPFGGLGQVPANALSADAPQAKGKASAKEATTYTDLYVGLQFTHAATWKLKKKGRDLTEYTVPVDGSLDTADLQILRATFHAGKDDWQNIQIRANDTMHRQIVRQWEQEVIGVPMLCTQLAYVDKGVPVTTLTGLYYTKTPQKLLVRLTAPSADFDKVKYGFDQTLQSLQTTNGTTPEVDDPDFKFADTKRPQLAPPPPDVIGIGAPAAPKLLRGLTSVALVVSTKPLKLRIPRDWVVGRIKDNEVTLRNPRLSGDVSVVVHFSLDSERPALALIRASASELDEFAPGVKREDTDPTPNLEGCAISTVWRIGKTAKGSLFTFHASGEQSDFYFIAGFRTTETKLLREDRRLVAALMDEISIEPSGP